MAPSDHTGRELQIAKKFTHAAVKYVEKSKFPQMKCSGCVHFINVQPARCEGVKSPIAPGGWCKRFKKLPEGANHDGKANV